MADAKTKKPRKPQGPRQVRPLYLLTTSPVEVLAVTRDPLAIVKLMSEGKSVNFIDLNTYLPKKAKSDDAQSA